ALIDPPEGIRPGAAILRAISDASDNLVDPLNTARLAKNTTFLSAYTAQLRTTLPKLLDNNLIARTQAMIVLGQTGDRELMPVFLNQLRDKNQTVQVQLWALRGIANVVDNGTRTAALSAAEAIAAGKV